MIVATKKLWGMSVAGDDVLGNFSHNLCHNKIAKQVAGKIAKCNGGLKERWSFGIRTNMAKCGFNLLVAETEWPLATGIEQNWKMRSEIQNFHAFQKRQPSDIFCLLLKVYNVMLNVSDKRVPNTSTSRHFFLYLSSKFFMYSSCFWTSFFHSSVAMASTKPNW